MIMGKQIIRLLVIADQIMRNILMGIPWISKLRLRTGRTARIPGELHEDHLIMYAYDPYQMVVDVLGETGITGRDVGEIGPGDHISAALLFLGSGAKRYVAYDRFPGPIGSQNAKKQYISLVKDVERRNPDIAHGLKMRGIEASMFPENYRDLVFHDVCPIEEIPDDRRQSLDVIYSYNVVEHLYDIDKFSMNSFILLRPGGMAIHRIDFAPHDVLLNRLGAFEWLTIKPFTWNLMGSNRGIPNRKRFHEIYESLERAGFLLDGSILERYPEKLVDSVRPRLSMPFRQMPVESLCIKTAIIKCKKKQSG